MTQIVYLGALYFYFSELQNNNISSFLDKTVSCSDKQSVPEYLLDYHLLKINIAGRYKQCIQWKVIV